jgi:hypothetical protein
MGSPQVLLNDAKVDVPVAAGTLYAIAANCHRKFLCVPCLPQSQRQDRNWSR